MSPSHSQSLISLFENMSGYREMYSAMIHAIEGKSMTDIRNAFPKEYTSWKDRKYASSQNGIEWHSAILGFKDFLTVMGPIPRPGWTLDRINPTGGYVPDNLRWADKATQSQNRTCARSVRFENQSFTLAEVARILGQSYDQTRMQLDRKGPEPLVARLRLHFSDDRPTEETWEFCDAGTTELGDVPFFDEDELAFLEEQYQQEGRGRSKLGYFIHFFDRLHAHLVARNNDEASEDDDAIKTAEREWRLERARHFLALGRRHLSVINARAETRQRYPRLQTAAIDCRKGFGPITDDQFDLEFPDHDLPFLTDTAIRERLLKKRRK